MDILINCFTIWLQTFGLSLLQPAHRNTLFCWIRCEANLASGQVVQLEKTSWTPSPQGSYTGLLEAGFVCRPLIWGWAHRMWAELTATPCLALGSQKGRCGTAPPDLWCTATPPRLANPGAREIDAAACMPLTSGSLLSSKTG